MTEAVTAATDVPPATARDDIYARIECLRIAAGMPDTHTTGSLISNAEMILNFAKGGAQ